MGAGTTTIFSASAGSGKTFNLTRVYLEMLFSSRYRYRRILAVTFTHKATSEMKARILDALSNLASGDKSGYLEGLIAATGKSEEELRKESGEILLLILHDYSRFSISTIDSFFQKILRAFARDIGLHYGFNVEIDHTAVMTAAVDKMISSAATEPSLRKWLSDYIRSNIEDDKSWNVRKNIIDLSEELFKEKLRLVSPEEKLKLQDKIFLGEYIKELRAFTYGFESEMEAAGREGLEIIRKFGLPDEVFYYKTKGIPGFLKSLVDGNIKAPNQYVRAAVEGTPPKWTTGSIPDALEKAIGGGLEDTLKKALDYYDRNIVLYNTSRIILSNIYTLGILSDVLSQVHVITNEENIFLLSDTGELIYRITENDQAPFIYEKVGNYFENFMIDEFQDTSIIQWNNLRMLINNSMAQGFDNLVVGDIKQSIYRWRNSSWQTLHDLKKAVDNRRFISQPLKTNWRSCHNIIIFNNSLFSSLPAILDKEFTENGIRSGFSQLYSEVIQEDPGKRNGGYVRIEFLADTDEGGWKDQVLDRLPEIIVSVLNKGYKSSEIGILVRDNREGAAVMEKIISFSSSLPEEEKQRFNIVSNDSLLLINSPVINFLISLLLVLDNQENVVARAALLRFYLLTTGHRDAETVPLESNNLVEISEEYLPDGFEMFLSDVKYLTLWDITEKSIRFFRLGEYSYNVAYLNSFQDLILRFSMGKNPGISAFLDWWNTEGYRKSISLPEHQDSIKVLTIHKSKGLEFAVVIIPFISWNLDHKSLQSNILWVRPGVAPFNKLGIVPVRYRKDLSETIFAEDYNNEKYSAYIDNLNLLYVAFTRAKNALFGFAPVTQYSSNTIARVLNSAITGNEEGWNGKESLFTNFYDPDKGVFDFGTLPFQTHIPDSEQFMDILKYPVSADIESLKLKLNWENYLNTDPSGVRFKINYGKLMHEVFEEIITSDDIETAVRKKVIEGKIPAAEETEMIEKISLKAGMPGVSKWFEEGNEVLTEATILIPRSGTRRPDRIILRNGKTIIVDFKFGEENNQYLTQIRQYKFLLSEMGYGNIEAFLWYVDSDKIVSA
jgi:ATP-dependent helicase/nuclease subunit A